ncbi:Tryptophan--tRNA ligase, chloroplastic/mitochondrial [Trebouxia sp. C0010 RCD-2024]
MPTSVLFRRPLALRTMQTYLQRQSLATAYTEFRTYQGRSCCHLSKTPSQKASRHQHSCAAQSAAGVVTEPATSPVSSQTQPPAAARRKRVLSGVQPTGTLHLGNYLGAIRNWVNLQELYETYFCVVDLHAITLPHEPKALLESTRKSAATYIACGIDPEKANIFVQSHVSAHAELAWLLSCATPIGWLRKMVQFKEKSQTRGAEEVSTGLLTYPVLMAADILLYQTDVVPVGNDQMQHLELTRDIAERMNTKYGGSKWKKLGGRGGRIFKVPDAFIAPVGARIMSLTEGTSKMSKSAELDASRINLLDDPKLIQQKVKRAKTDTFEGLEFGNPERPEATNLLGIYSLCTGISMDALLDEVRDMRWGQFKSNLADAIVAHLEPIQQTYHDVIADKTYLDQVLAKGAEEANKTANFTLENCRQAMGFTPKYGDRQ